jgi:hypothetical protein
MTISRLGHERTWFVCGGATCVETAMVVECCLRSALTELLQFLVYFHQGIEAHSVTI